MKKKTLLQMLMFTAVIVSISLFGMVGCGDETSDDSNEEAAAEEVAIDFSLINDQMHEDIEIGEDSSEYPYVRDFYLTESNGQITIAATVEDSTDPEKALDFADTLVRYANLCANMQDSTIELASGDTYGGLYDRYNALIGVSAASTIDDTSKYFVYDAITSANGPELNLQ